MGEAHGLEDDTWGYISAKEKKSSEYCRGDSFCRRCASIYRNSILGRYQKISSKDCNSLELSDLALRENEISIRHSTSTFNVTTTTAASTVPSLQFPLILSPSPSIHFPPSIP